MNTCPLHTHPWRSREERKESRKQHMKTDREGEREKDSLHTEISCGNACCSVIIYCCHPISSFLSYASCGMRRKRIVFLRRIEKQAREHLLHLLLCPSDVSALRWPVELKFNGQNLRFVHLTFLAASVQQPSLPLPLSSKGVRGFLAFWVASIQFSQLNNDRALY